MRAVKRLEAENKEKDTLMARSQSVFEETNKKHAENGRKRQQADAVAAEEKERAEALLKLEREARRRAASSPQQALSVALSHARDRQLLCFQGDGECDDLQLRSVGARADQRPDCQRLLGRCQLGHL